MKVNEQQQNCNYYEIETYALFHNVDSSILLVNDVLKKFGYIFVKIDLTQLENKFFELLDFPNEFKSKNSVQLPNSTLTISNEFFQVLINNQLFGHNAILNEEVFFLKATSNFQQAVIENTVNMSDAISILGKFQTFSDSLLQQFRLFKNGDIFYSTIFQISKTTNKITSKYSTNFSSSNGGQLFNLKEEDIINIDSFFVSLFSKNPTTELAINYFNLTYTLRDEKTKFMLLMSCLESLLNLGKDQISHTISRHLSIIISENKDEFLSNYKAIKKLYSIRSKIVHGENHPENLVDNLHQLQNFTRSAINFCLINKFSKKELFDYLNSKGFE